MDWTQSRVRAGAAAVGLLAIALQSACGGSTTAGTPTSSGAKPVLTIGASFPYANLDPARDTIYFARPLTNESILHMNTDGSFAPALATSWHYVSGSQNKDFEFTLRQNARFWDGSAVNAEAVKTWYDYYFRTPGPYQAYFGGVSSVDTNGQWTVVLHLKGPNPSVPFLLSDQNPSGAIASPDCAAKPSLFTTQTCGAGPYTIDPSQSVTGDHYTYLPNGYYYDKTKIRYSKIVVKVITTPSSMLQALQSGQLDVGQGEVNTGDAAAAAGLRVAAGVNGRLGMTLDPSGAVVKALADLRVRQALNYALDRKAIAAAAAGRYGSPTSEWASSDGTDPKYDSYYKYDVAKAKSLLAAAGYAGGFNVDNVTVGGASPQLNQAMAQAVAKYLDAIGVHLTLNSLANTQDWVKTVLTKPAPMQTVAIVGSRPTYLQYAFFYAPGGNFNRIGSGWEDPQITSWYKSALTASDPPTYWRQITDRAVTEAYFLPVLSTTQLWYSSKRVQGVSVSSAQPSPNPLDWSPR